MKLTAIYKKRVEDVSNDIIKSILNYLTCEKIKTISLKDENDTFIISKENCSIITSEDETYLLNELSTESLLYIIQNLEIDNYEKID